MTRGRCAGQPALILADNGGRCNWEGAKCRRSTTIETLAADIGGSTELEAEAGQIRFWQNSWTRTDLGQLTRWNRIAIPPRFSGATRRAVG
jgi:hypothetical protein